MDLPKRKPNRLPGYDYSAPGVYFITICTQNRKPLLSEIVGGGVLDAPRVRLTKCGEIADAQIKAMQAFYENISLDRYVIMPNHVHLLLTVLPVGPSGTPAPTKARQNSTVAGFVSTFKRFCNRDCGQSLFQRSYHDHIVRGEADYQEIVRYIAENPARWQEDCFYEAK